MYSKIRNVTYFYWHVKDKKTYINSIHLVCRLLTFFHKKIPHIYVTENRNNIFKHLFLYYHKATEDLGSVELFTLSDLVLCFMSIMILLCRWRNHLSPLPKMILPFLFPNLPLLFSYILAFVWGLCFQKQVQRRLNYWFSVLI